MTTHLQISPVCQTIISQTLATARAWRILVEAEEAFAAQCRARARAAANGCPRPATIAGYLYWLKVEATYQKSQPRQTPTRRRLVRALTGVAQELRDLGFNPAPPALSPAPSVALSQTEPATPRSSPEVPVPQVQPAGRPRT